MDAVEDREITKTTCTNVGCDVDAPRLRKIIGVIAKTDSGAPITLRTSRNGTTISRGSLEKLLAAVHESTEPGNPDDIDNVEIEARGGARKVSFTLESTVVTWTVEGDTSWTRGVTEQIRDLLAEGGGRKQASAGGLLYAAIIVPFVAAVATALLATGRIPPTGWSVASGVLLVVVGGLAGFVLGRIRQRRDRCRLSAVGELPPRRWWNGIDVGTRTAVVVAVIAFLALIVNALNALR